MDRFLQTLVALTSFYTARRDDEEGATAVEYGLIVALIAVFLIAALGVLGTALDGIFRQIATAISAVN